jgi:hypothetical protein
MNMARATDYDIENVVAILNLLEEWHDYGTRTPDDGKAERVDDARLAKLLTDYMGRCPGALSRVVWGYQMLRDNCTDPTLTHLDWKPEVKAAIEAYEAKDEEETTNARMP